jgi:RNA polymerase sigma factor (sigma-70 family)
MGKFDFNDTLENRCVASYIDEARAMITRFAGNGTALLQDEDVITNVASSIAKAEHSFDSSRGCKRSTLRMTYGKHQIWKELRNLAKRKENTFSIDSPRRVADFNGDYQAKGMDIEDYRECMSNKMEEEEERDKRIKFARSMIKLLSLTKKQKEYLHLRYVDGISVNDIATKNKCTKQAVFQVIQGGLRRLRKKFSQCKV